LYGADPGENDLVRGVGPNGWHGPGLCGGGAVNGQHPRGSISASVTIPERDCIPSNWDDETRPKNVSVHWLIRAR